MRYNYAKDLAVSRRLTLYFDAFLGLTVRQAIVNHINESFHELLLFLHPNLGYASPLEGNCNHWKYAFSL